MTIETESRVREYVLNNYKRMFTPESTMIIKEYDSFFAVLKHQTGSPLILGKDILN